jgi:superfamily II DNA or RNA helicase
MRSNLTSLERLEAQIRALQEGTPQGAAWEKALKGWINAGGHPELIKAWMWGEWPGKLKAGLKGDKGVDLVAETRDKQLVAIQVKFRKNPNDPVTAPEVQKLVGSYRKHFTLFALASNAWSATRGVSEAVGDEDAMLILREQLLESNYDWAAKKSIKRTKFTPFPFQKVAAENVRKALEKGGRAQIVMACGTGKTVTMLLAAEALDAQRVLVLAPTLLLVKQLRDEWISKRRPDREWASLAVCSDIGDGVDASEIAPAEFGAPPTTNPDDIAAFLKKPGRRVVFGTYASSERIAKAQKKAGVPAFDLAVADEAHRIAGVVSAKDKSERSQRVMLEEKEIKAVRRLFATATPRITGSKKTREGDEILIESMDDESRFGKVAHSVTFHEAVKLKRLVPYKLVVTIVTDDDVAEAVHNRKFIDVNGTTYGTDEVATAIAIRRAYKDLGISKIISYHSRVAGAKSFADLITQVPGRSKAPVTEHVAGSMPVNDRKQVLNRLAAATEPYLVTNARCLTEGIDVPALDAVAFADPRKSQVDIVQAVGRAMRRPIGKSTKTTGYIILPVYLTKVELKDPETAVEGSAFEPVLQVLRALKDHDPFMARFMAKILVAKGKKPHQKPGGIEEILEVLSGAGLDKVLTGRLLAAVQLRAIEVSSDNFEANCLRLEAVASERGSLRNLGDDYSFQGLNVSSWMTTLRGAIKHGSLSQNRIERLERIPGWSLDPYEDDFLQGLTFLEEFVKRNGTTKVPVDFLNEAGFNLGLWVENVRNRNRRGNYPKERVDRFTVFPDWDWDPRQSWFEKGFSALVEYLDGRPVTALTDRAGRHQGIALYHWVMARKAAKRNGTLSKEHGSRLESLPGWAWDNADEKKERLLAAFEAFSEAHGMGSLNMKTEFRGLKLGIASQNLRKRKSIQTAETIRRLEAIPGWTWEGLKEDKWQEFYDLLKLWARETGSARVTQKEVFKGKRLGAWATVQRTAMRSSWASMTPERIRLLESLPGWDWNPSKGGAGRRKR